jgi:hypothetical protein
MPTESPKRLGHVMPLRGSANAGQYNTSTGPLGVSSLTIDADRQMAEMECVFRPAGNHTQQMEALATLRRWQFDPRLDHASRQRASALVWKFQPNGWDEV